MPCSVAPHAQRAAVGALRTGTCVSHSARAASFEQRQQPQAGGRRQPCGWRGCSAAGRGTLCRTAAGAAAAYSVSRRSAWGRICWQMDWPVRPRVVLP